MHTRCESPKKITNRWKIVLFIPVNLVYLDFLFNKQALGYYVSPQTMFSIYTQD